MSQETVKINGDFIDVLVHTSKIQVVEVKYFQSAQYGTTYSITFRIMNTPQVAEYLFVCKVNTKYSKEYTCNWGKAPANTIGLLADFVETDHKTFKDLVKSKNSVAISQAIIRTNRLMKVSAKIVPKTENQQLYAKVFNIATELHTTVTFTEIRNTLMEIFKLPVVKEIPNNDMQPNRYILEESVKGELVWSVFQSQSRIKDESFDSSIEIDSGNNTKQNAIEVIGKIKVGSCMNSLRVAINLRILRVGEWKTRLIEYISKAKTLLNEALRVIERSITHQIPIDQCINYIETLDFGLKDQKKIGIIRELVKNRLMFEYSKNPTLWSASQALTYVGSHQDEYMTNEIQQEMEVTNTTFERMQEYGYNILVNPPQ